MIEISDSLFCSSYIVFLATVILQNRFTKQFFFSSSFLRFATHLFLQRTKNHLKSLERNHVSQVKKFCLNATMVHQFVMHVRTSVLDSALRDEVIRMYHDSF